MLAAYYAGQPLARAFLLNQSAASLAALSKYLAPLTVPRALLQLGDANALMYCNHRAAGDQARRARAVSAYTACIREANSSLRGQRFAGLCRDRLRRLGAHGYPDVDERYGRNIGFSHLRSLEQPALRRR